MRKEYSIPELEIEELEEEDNVMTSNIGMEEDEIEGIPEEGDDNL